MARFEQITLEKGMSNVPGKTFTQGAGRTGQQLKLSGHS